MLFLLLHIIRYQKLCEIAAACLLAAASNASKFSPHSQKGTSISNTSSRYHIFESRQDSVQDKASWQLSSLATRSKFLLWLIVEEKRSDNHVRQHCSLWQWLRILKIYLGNPQRYVDTQLKKLQFSTRIAEINLKSNIEKKENKQLCLILSWL